MGSGIFFGVSGAGTSAVGALVGAAASATGTPSAIGVGAPSAAALALRLAAFASETFNSTKSTAKTAST